MVKNAILKTITVIVYFDFLYGISTLNSPTCIFSSFGPNTKSGGSNK